MGTKISCSTDSVYTQSFLQMSVVEKQACVGIQTSWGYTVGITPE